MTFDVVVPTVGRPCLRALLEVLAAERLTARVVLVDDRRDASAPLPTVEGLDIEVVRGGAAGPAAARNLGWRSCTSTWVAFLDDDVVPDPGWVDALEADLHACGDDVGATQGRLRVPLPAHRRPTDWERNVAGLEQARWATADMAYRRDVLVAVGGFDERFPRAYREDADLGLRVTAAGWRIVHGRRTVAHPVRPAPWHVSVGKQAGNGDDALMDRLHGPGWRQRAGAPSGSRRRHLAVVAAVVGLVRRPRWALAVWVAATADLAWRRIAPGPSDRREVAAMVATSAVLPFTAAWHWGLGRLRPIAPVVDAVLLDRDGTIVVDVPYNGDPARVVPMPGARRALDRLRRSGMRVALVTNQSGIGRGQLSAAAVQAVNERVDDLLGPFDAVLVCPHAPEDGCECRKPAPGLVRKAMAELGVEPGRCAFIGDIGADVEAALVAGVRPILVPTDVTRLDEVRSAPTVAPDLGSAVDLLVGRR